MTCLEKYMQEHPNVPKERILTVYCPNGTGMMYEMDEPEYCPQENGTPECVKCWNREFIDTKPVNEERNIPMTKEQMLEEIEKANATIHEMENRLKNLERYKAYEDMADEMKAMHTAFMNSGFSDEQAYDLMKTILNMAVPALMKGLV